MPLYPRLQPGCTSQRQPSSSRTICCDAGEPSLRMPVICSCETRVPSAAQVAEMASADSRRRLAAAPTSRSPSRSRPLAPATASPAPAVVRRGRPRARRIPRRRGALPRERRRPPRGGGARTGRPSGGLRVRRCGNGRPAPIQVRACSASAARSSAWFVLWLVARPRRGSTSVRETEEHQHQALELHQLFG